MQSQALKSQRQAPETEILWILPATEGMDMDGSIADAEALASLENKHQLIRDRVTAVAKGYQAGLCIYGMGGVGKSYTILQHLDRLEITYKLFNRVVAQ